MASQQSQLDFSFDAPRQNVVDDGQYLCAAANVGERFERFHESNPHVYVAIVSIARSLRDAGWPRCGMKMIFEQLRWRYAVKTRGEKWNFNNNFTAYYSRLVMEREPDLAGFFETRERRATPGGF